MVQKEYKMHFLSVKKGQWSSEINGSEDSLYLSVFTPILNSNLDLPVFALVHGGYLQYGSGNWNGYYLHTKFRV